MALQQENAGVDRHVKFCEKTVNDLRFLKKDANLVDRVFVSIQRVPKNVLDQSAEEWSKTPPAGVHEGSL